MSLVSRSNLHRPALLASRTAEVDRTTATALPAVTPPHRSPSLGAPGAAACGSLRGPSHGTAIGEACARRGGSPLSNVIPCGVTPPEPGYGRRSAFRFPGSLVHVQRVALWSGPVGRRPPRPAQGVPRRERLGEGAHVSSTERHAVRGALFGVPPWTLTPYVAEGCVLPTWSPFGLCAAGSSGRTR